MWTTGFPITVYLRVCLSSSVCSWPPGQTSDGYSYMYFCDLFCSSCLWICFWACTILGFTLDLQYILHSDVVIPHIILFTRDCFGCIKTSRNIRKKVGREGKYRSISMVNTESKILNKIFENQIWTYIKKLSTMTKMPFVVFSPANKEFSFLFSYYYLFNFLLFPNCSRSGEHGCSGLIPFNVMTSSVSLFPIVLAVGLSYIAFIVLRYIYFQTYTTKNFYHEGILDFVKEGFFSSIEVIMWFLFLSTLVWFITFIYLSMLNHTCISSIKPMKS